jgi:hypothetical protein
MVGILLFGQECIKADCTAVDTVTSQALSDDSHILPDTLANSTGEGFCKEVHGQKILIVHFLN